LKFLAAKAKREIWIVIQFSLHKSKQETQLFLDLEIKEKFLLGSVREESTQQFSCDKFNNTFAQLFLTKASLIVDVGLNSKS
jgi:hypothetical protein